jgi:hypothetical protein
MPIQTLARLRPSLQAEAEEKAEVRMNEKIRLQRGAQDAIRLKVIQNIEREGTSPMGLVRTNHEM